MKCVDVTRLHRKSGGMGHPVRRSSDARQTLSEAYGIALNGLAGRLPQTSADPSPETVRHLRQFTSYLAPQLGFSLDVWDLFAIVVRNLLINWLMLAPLLLFFATLATLLVFALRGAYQPVNNNQPFFFVLLTVSPLVTIRMALFNVRLGWWLPNPRFPLDRKYETPKRNEFWRQSSPLFSVWPLLQELFGLTDDTSSYVELTDGGHFENLGLYEMVMRRCKNIIVVDAGADPTSTYEDLGNALRKIEIDLGIPIEFAKKPTMQAGHEGMAHAENRYCAVGSIRYSCVDSNAFPDLDCRDLAGKLDGTLVYIKACLNGESEPMGVAEYSNSHRMFPHEPTSDQFFNEAQFESYRSLGSHAAECIGGKKGMGWLDWIAAAKIHAGVDVLEETC